MPAIPVTVAAARPCLLRQQQRSPFAGRQQRLQVGVDVTQVSQRQAPRGVQPLDDMEDANDSGSCLRMAQTGFCRSNLSCLQSPLRHSQQQKIGHTRKSQLL